MPPKNWMIAAAGAVLLASPVPKIAVGEQQAEAGPGVRLEQEQDRLALLGRLVDAERGEHAVVDGVVEEQHLGRLDDEAGQRQQAVVDQPVHRRCRARSRRPR